MEPDPLVAYVRWTGEYKVVRQAGTLSETELHVYADADLASCVHAAGSTSGMMLFSLFPSFVLPDRMELAAPNVSR